FGLPARHLGLADVDQRRLAHAVAGPSEREELLVPLELLLSDVGGLPRLQHSQVLLGDCRAQRLCRTDAVGVGAALLSALQRSGRQRLSRQLPVEAEAVARGLRRDALREILGQEPLRSRAAVADAAGGGDRWEENVREGVARRPGSGSG